MSQPRPLFLLIFVPYFAPVLETDYIWKGRNINQRVKLCQVPSSLKRTSNYSNNFIAQRHIRLAGNATAEWTATKRNTSVKSWRHLKRWTVTIVLTEHCGVVLVMLKFTLWTHQWGKSKKDVDADWKKNWIDQRLSKDK